MCGQGEGLAPHSFRLPTRQSYQPSVNPSPQASILLPPKPFSCAVSSTHPHAHPLKEVLLGQSTLSLPQSSQHCQAPLQGLHHLVPGLCFFS